MDEKPTSAQPSSLREQTLALVPEIRGPVAQKFLAGLVLFNLVILFARPQFSLPFLHLLQLPLVFSILGGVVWVSRFRSG